MVGVSLLYSSANGKNFYFDDFTVTDAAAHRLLIRVAVVDARTLDVVFNEAVDPTSAADPGHYRLAGGGRAGWGRSFGAEPGGGAADVRAGFFASANTLEVRQLA